MNIQQLFIHSNQALARTIAIISDDQWSLAMPEGTTMRPATLEQTVRYHTYDDAWVPDVLAGRTIEEVGDTYDELKTSGDIRGQYAEHNARANRAVEELDDPNKTVHLSYGDFPADEYLRHVTSYRALHVYDIAKLIGADTSMDPDYAQSMIDELAPVVDGYRQMGIFPPARTVTDDASARDRMLAMFGRE